MMTCGKCSRCGCEESTFWYPYAFGVQAFSPAERGLSYRDSQYYVLCDRCQMDFIRFMDPHAQIPDTFLEVPQ